MTATRCLSLLTLLLAGVSSAAAAEPADANALRDLVASGALSKPPTTRPADDFGAAGVTPLFFDALPHNGKPTRAFAWVGLPDGASADRKAPGVVLVHGGGGTAFDAWVRLWTARGYAAIAMDTCGQVPRGSYGKWERHADGGPPGWGGFASVDEPPAEQWTYHAVADVILAHSLLRSMPEVDADRVGITGISWGGYLTCIAAGLDGRFKFAAPVYGCGFLGDNSTWVPQFRKMGPDKAGRWLAMWDPSQYLRGARMPMLWVNGTNDFAYPPDSWQKSYRLPPGPRWLSLKVRMPHGHNGPGENPEEIRAFADAVCKGERPLLAVTGQGRDGGRAWATYGEGSAAAKAELVFTRDAGPWQKRQWETAPADVEASARRVTAEVPTGVTAHYLNLTDDRGLVVSTEHQATGPASRPAAD